MDVLVLCIFELYHHFLVSNAQHERSRNGSQIRLLLHMVVHVSLIYILFVCLSPAWQLGIEIQLWSCDPSCHIEYYQKLEFLVIRKDVILISLKCSLDLLTMLTTIVDLSNWLMDTFKQWANDVGTQMVLHKNYRYKHIGSQNENRPLWFWVLDLVNCRYYWH